MATAFICPNERAADYSSNFFDMDPISIIHHVG